ncbi:hypothetical protein LWC35_34470 [Pseudonocardia kujensis]|uniref:hypothetical protein n=1 Tax=Pseudonocardia kujensis TaxID=1128675 RepID=UPI001E292183|nr:hypothetical protein [Pseudonocardia kujensis]MCE0767967.1 hypothetical protein [Pseudonocardia kujensis]
MMHGAGWWEAVVGAACLLAAAVFLARAARGGRPGTTAHRHGALGHGGMALAMGAMAAGQLVLSAALAAVSCLFTLAGRRRGEGGDVLHSCVAGCAMVAMPLVAGMHDGLTPAAACLALTGYFAVRSGRWLAAVARPGLRLEPVAHLVMSGAMATTFLTMI